MSPSAKTRLRRALRTSLHNNAAAYGFSVMITASFGVLQIEAPPVTLPRLFLFLGGAATAFTTVDLLGGHLFFRQSAREEPPEVVMIGAAMNLVSVSGSVAAAVAVALVAGSWIGWLAAPYTATVVYVFLVSIELMTAELASGEDDD